ncbi:MAG: sigma 54-interacting transcriptional regulator [Planctomycetota bacterium]
MAATTGPQPGSPTPQPPLPPARSALRHNFARVVGESPALLRALAAADAAASTPFPVLITGETGTGKTVLAEAIHVASGRAGAFVALNCAALPAQLVESQLFGHIKGAFTGADADARGLFEQADGGTLFLDEIGDLALDAQAKLLRAIELGLVRRVGSDKEVRVSVRFICATHRVLRERIAAGDFREDLHYRINTFTIDMPPLRERGAGDVAMLARMFLSQIAAEAGGPARALSDDAAARLATHDWPGNLRELQAVLRQAWVRAGDAMMILPAHLPPLQSPSAAQVATSRTSPTPAGSEEESELTLRMRDVLTRGDDPTAWAAFLLALADHVGSTTFSRGDVTDALRPVRGEQTEAALNYEWRDLRVRLLNSGFASAEGRKFRIDRAACERATASSTPTSAAAPAPTPAAPETAAPAAPAAAPTPARPLLPGALPARRAELVGREGDLADLAQRLRGGARLVTLCGPGGVGKTTLAIRGGQEVAEAFPGGAVFVDLTRATTRHDLLHAVAAALGLGSGDDLNQQITWVLASATAPQLLVLDNFEQLVDHAGDTVARWLNLAPALALIVASRVALGLRDEQRMELEPLGVPAAGDTAAITPQSLVRNDSVRLFVRRAREAVPDFDLRPDNVAAVAQICRDLSGLPLALELAAAHVRLLPPPQLAERLTKKFDWLRATRRDVAAHHGGLREALEWSFDLLEPWQQDAFLALTTFRGGFTLEAAEAVLPAVLDGRAAIEALAALQDRSLLRRFDDPRWPPSAGPRFTMYPLISEYAAHARAQAPDRLPTDALDLAHATHFAAVGDAWRAIFFGTPARHNEASSVLAIERANLQAARNAALRLNEPALAARAQVAFDAISLQLGEMLREMEAQVNELLAAMPAEPLSLERVLLTVDRADLSYMLYDHLPPDGVIEHHDAVIDQLRAAESRGEIRDAAMRGAFGEALTSRARLARRAGDQDGAFRLGGEAIDFYKRHGDRPGQVDGMYMQALGRFHLGQPREARDQFEAARQIAHDIGDRGREIDCLAWCGMTMVNSTDPDEIADARRMLLEVQDAYRDSRGWHSLATISLQLATFELRNSTPEAAERHALEAQHACHQAGMPGVLARVLLQRARAASLAGRWADVLPLVAELEALVRDAYTSPQNLVVARWMHARALIAMGDAPTAVTMLESLLEDDQAEPEPRVRYMVLTALSRAYRAAGNTARADATRDEAVALAALAGLKLAMDVVELRVAAGDIDQALPAG